MGQPARFGDWVYRALTFLVISCPCALVISIPLSFFGGIGGASACGILVKGSTYLEELARTGIVVFDKTGTLTQGTFKVVGIHPENGVTGDALVEAAALAENWSRHPISLSIRNAYGKDIDPSRVTDVQELGGHGVTAKVDGKTVAAGNAPPDGKAGPDSSRDHRAGHHRPCCHGGRYAGYLLIADVVKPHSAAAIKGLKQAGVRKTVMLTGDAEPVAKAFPPSWGWMNTMQVCCPVIRWTGSKRSSPQSSPKKTSLLWATASTMPRFCPVRMWASPWVLLAPMLPSRPLMLS